MAEPRSGEGILARGFNPGNEIEFDGRPVNGAKWHTGRLVLLEFVDLKRHEFIAFGQKHLKGQEKHRG